MSKGFYLADFWYNSLDALWSGEVFSSEPERLPSGSVCYPNVEVFRAAGRDTAQAKLNEWRIKYAPLCISQHIGQFAHEEPLDEHMQPYCCQCGEDVGADGGVSGEGLPRCAACIGEDAKHV